MYMCMNCKLLLLQACQAAQELGPMQRPDLWPCVPSGLLPHAELFREMLSAEL
jgi:hypothetical protein